MTLLVKTQLMFLLKQCGFPGETFITKFSFEEREDFVCNRNILYCQNQQKRNEWC